MAVYLSPLFGAGAQLFTNGGVVLAGGSISTFLAGTTTPANTWSDNSGAVSNGVTIPLDSAGRPGSPTNVEIWLTAGQALKFIVKDVNGVQIGLPYDNIIGINDPSGTVAQNTEWVATGLTPAFISSTSFSLPGDVRAKFPIGQRVKSTVTAGTADSTVSIAPTYSAPNTTITVVNDGTALDSGLSAVSYGLLNAANPSVDAIGVKYDASIVVPATPTSIASPIQRYDRSITLTTTTGTAPSFVLTPTQPLSAYATNAPVLVKFSAASGTSPTLNISGLGALNLKQVDGTGTKQPATFAAGQISEVVYDGTDLVLINLPIAPGRFLRRTVITASGTWTKGTGTTQVNVICVGGGGGGGANGSDAGGGGGAGGTAIKYAVEANATETVTIGAGGSTAAAGGTSSFGAVCSGLGGGAGGSSGRGGGLGGSASGGDINIQGGPGGWGGNGTGGQIGGAGGNSYLGGGAQTATGSGQSTGSAAAANSGGGGGGGVSVGGAGGSGIVVVEEYS